MNAQLNQPPDKGVISLGASQKRIGGFAGIRETQPPDKGVACHRQAGGLPEQSLDHRAATTSALFTAALAAEQYHDHHKLSDRSTPSTRRGKNRTRATVKAARRANRVMRARGK